ncbi:carbohydrate ABC transporter permease [Defluviitalea phaphyphila]|uniref:carbohydrate ABC transporter permease n=1 Tax=Defluviitalea phaphyphila TaxID=1473580 RepID=UPI00192D0628|nr:carbohydrate ABC transporter permease [Defluviitalea phaphyphila]
MKHRLMPFISKALIYIFLILTTLPIIIAYLWLFTSSFSKQVTFGIIPKNFTITNWRFLWDEIKLGLTVFESIWPITFNSILLAGSVTILEVIISLMAGFALSRLDFWGKDFIMKCTIILHAFPGVALLIALYYVLNFASLIDSIIGVVLVKVALELPMATWMIKGFFDEIPWDIEWAAYIDGCTKFQAWYKIILPHIKPGIAAVAIFAFLAGWSEFIYSYIFLFSSKNYTLSVFIKNLIGDFRFLDYGLLSAAGLFYLIPVIVFFLISQKSLMKVQFGGIKG